MPLNRYVAGSLIAGIIVFVALSCLRLYLLHLQQLGARKKWRASVVRLLCEPQANPSSTSNEITVFIDMPAKSVARNLHSYSLPDEAGVSSQYASLPTSSTPSHHPPSYPCATSLLSPAHLRHSRSSSGFSDYTHCPSPPGLHRSSRLSFSGFMSPSWASPVHQTFEPTLPDELALQCGEYVTVLRSYDDGWCAVARNTSHYSRASLVSVGTKTGGDNVDIGIVPAWVFAEPFEGVTSTRPFRSTSLNALRFGPNPAHARDTVISSADLAS